MACQKFFHSTHPGHTNILEGIDNVGGNMVLIHLNHWYTASTKYHKIKNRGVDVDIRDRYGDDDENSYGIIGCDESDKNGYNDDDYYDGNNEDDENNSNNYNDNGNENDNNDNNGGNSSNTGSSASASSSSRSSNNNVI